MDFAAVLDQVVDPLRQHGRLTDRTGMAPLCDP